MKRRVWAALGPCSGLPAICWAQRARPYLFPCWERARNVAVRLFRLWACPARASHRVTVAVAPCRAVWPHRSDALKLAAKIAAKKEAKAAAEAKAKAEAEKKARLEAYKAKASAAAGDDAAAAAGDAAAAAAASSDAAAAPKATKKPKAAKKPKIKLTAADLMLL